MDIIELVAWFKKLPTKLSKSQTIISKEILKEISTRLQFLLDVGLDSSSVDFTGETSSFEVFFVVFSIIVFCCSFGCSMIGTGSFFFSSAIEVFGVITFCSSTFLACLAFFKVLSIFHRRFYEC